MTPLLCAQQVLQWTDLEVLETYCSAYGDWRRACEDLDSNGLVVLSSQGSPIKNPAATVIQVPTDAPVMIGYTYVEGKFTAPPVLPLSADDLKALNTATRDALSRSPRWQRIRLRH
ncbi:phage terminase small subunit P27 family [Caballeronia choica]|uniref:phage terminase small subunit P27 family n=1 Tax=Caballeronia choica TaxID=326476 RepID=UPI001F1D2EA2|nr:phage terminase small subunit P27 family [Caballeronia choica]